MVEAVEELLLMIDENTVVVSNEPDATSISDRGLFCLLAGNLSPGVFGLSDKICHYRTRSG